MLREKVSPLPQGAHLQVATTGHQTEPKRKEIPFTAKSNGELGLLFMTFSLNLHLFSIRIIPSEIFLEDFHSFMLTFCSSNGRVHVEAGNGGFPA